MLAHVINGNAIKMIMWSMLGVLVQFHKLHYNDNEVTAVDAGGLENIKTCFSGQSNYY